MALGGEGSSRIGEVLASAYRLDQLLAVGGMGELYRATHFSAAGPLKVAVKLLHPELAKNPEVVARFMREARASNSVRHANVVSVLDVGVDASGVPFLVLELLEGMDLHAWLGKKGGTVSPRAAVAVVLPIARALTMAHAAGVVHRDVKPENVFLAKGPDGRVIPKLVDFGISRVVADEATGPRLTANAPMGTPAYMSPEQVRSARDVDGRGDVWSVGVLLYELLTGRFPFEATDPNQMVVAIISSEPRPIEALAPDLPAPVLAVIRGCLVRNRDGRLTAGQLVEALELARDAVAADGTSIAPPPDAASVPFMLTQAKAASEALKPDPLAFPPSIVPPPPPRPASEGRKGRSLFRSALAIVCVLSLLAAVFTWRSYLLALAHY
ncbi:MAG: serine/threonine-protein kinase [Polyangiaceae bacterium]